MKKILFLFLLLLPLSMVTLAEYDVEKGFKEMLNEIAVQMKKAEECQKKTDADKIEAFKQNSIANDAKVEELCLVNRDKAQQLEDSFMEEALKDSDIAAYFECMFEDEDEPISDGDDENFSHICD